MNRDFREPPPDTALHRTTHASVDKLLIKLIKISFIFFFLIYVKYSFVAFAKTQMGNFPIESIVFIRGRSCPIRFLSKCKVLKIKLIKV